MASTKLKVAIVTAVLAAAGTALVLQHQAGNRLHTDNADLQRRVAQLTEAALAPRKATMQSMPDPGRSRELLAELLRLCGAFTQLQQKVVEQAPAAAARDQTAPPVLADRFGAPLVVGGEFVPHEQWGNAGSATPEAAAMTILWAWRSRNLQLLKEVSEPMTETTKLWLAENDPRGLDEEMSLERVAFIFDATQAARIKDVAESFLNLDQAQVQLECLKRDPDEGTIGITLPLRFASGTWRMAARQPLAAKP